MLVILLITLHPLEFAMKAVKKRILLSPFFILTLVVSMNSALSQTNNIIKKENSDLMTNQINRATGLLTEFKKNKSIDQLESALRAVEKISPPGIDKTVPRSVARHEQARMWLSLLATIDQNIDPSFDVNDAKNWAALNLVPETPEGVHYPSGVDPKEIKDPKTRAQYESAIKQNEAKKARLNFQIGLRNINELAGLDVGRFFPSYYTSSNEDKSELENLMHQAKLSPARTQKLKALFHK